MKRHEGLAQLSREHHPALVLARGLDPKTSPALQGGVPKAAEPLLAHLRAAWDQELAAHFLREERFLLPYSLCAGAALANLAETVAAQHRQIRTLFSQLTSENVLSRAPEIGLRLEQHVRLEERQWFPALEAALDDRMLARAARGMKDEPTALITGYHQDGDGAWVAELDCGHAPPFQNAVSTTGEAGRNEMLASELPCPYCCMSVVPPCAQVYEKTETYDEQTAPERLLRHHRLNGTTWGRIIVEQGRLEYVLEDENNHALTLCPGIEGVVGPERTHHLKLQPGVRFRILLLRTACSLS